MIRTARLGSRCCGVTSAGVRGNSRPDLESARGRGRAPKLIDRDLLSSSRERGPLPVGPHPRLLLDHEGTWPSLSVDGPSHSVTHGHTSFELHLGF